MSDIAIQCEGLGKRYRRGERAPYHRASELLTGWAKAPLQWVKPPRRMGNTAEIEAQREDESGWFWALKDINLEVKRGEVLGIIGRNGAGKSTLLKVLSEITEPTEGRVVMRGRVGSLLEVGTGFHPELTGRENIFLNGAVLGMTRPEIKAKFDEIVAFAEVDKFLDTPVKRYSSGMQTRLGFAVAAHLEPEILIVDEVLAVGDAAFQKKCLGKMDDVAKSGRTVLFVSHNMGAVRNLCHSAMLLQQGAMITRDSTESVLCAYESDMGFSLSYEADERKDMPIQITGCRVEFAEHAPESYAYSNQQGFDVIVQYRVNKPVANAHVFFRLRNAAGDTVLSSGDCDATPERFLQRVVGDYEARIRIPGPLLNEGTYAMSFATGIPFQMVYEKLEDIIVFSLHDGGATRSRSITQTRPGVLSMDLPWDTHALT